VAYTLPTLKLMGINSEALQGALMPYLEEIKTKNRNNNL
jgi:hypothetical protein